MHAASVLNLEFGFAKIVTVKEAMAMVHVWSTWWGNVLWNVDFELCFKSKKFFPFLLFCFLVVFFFRPTFFSCVYMEVNFLGKNGQTLGS
jgi:hypothetical protein